MRDTSNVRNAWQAYIDTSDEDNNLTLRIDELIDSLVEFADIKVNITIDGKVTIIDRAEV